MAAKREALRKRELANEMPQGSSEGPPACEDKTRPRAYIVTSYRRGECSVGDVTPAAYITLSLPLLVVHHVSATHTRALD
ncbi:hypothetical protein RR46_13272 [Papilio xuthus]|uniref:Uncharacterized protein n=1 Tax=Papilio xuthus TaxID=66420 RepID=A0A194PFA8_PAPXU|nr:hypothetical protein RR46_13272 [Papilio xuthus]